MITSEEELDLALSAPSSALIARMAETDGDIMVLGIGGKIGPTLGMTAVRAIRETDRPKQVYGVSRFSEPGLEERLSSSGIVTLNCDLLNEAAVRELPKVPNIIFMAGRKFGTIGAEDLTWAMNALVPAHVARSFPDSRIVVFSTGCVYPLVSPEGGGSSESDVAAPVGEYGWSCLARERMFSFYSRIAGTKVCLFRLNYAVDLRYGVLYDIAERIWSGRPVSLSVPYVNVIWQGDVNNQALLALDLCASPPDILNVTGSEILSVRELARMLAERFGKPVEFDEAGGTSALLSDSTRAISLFGQPSVSVMQMVDWTADWVMRGGRSLGKPTHFEVSDGRF
ncbi:MAG TPA: NAD(P)-dependent oxidoreductase [Spirochaetia bacterium]|nr:NAD(P)-dependent oxidoreductase [Spirochaetia bacterium]